jgi:hypothetical protein
MKRAHTVLLMGLLSLLFGCDRGGDYRKKDGAWHYKDRRLDVADPSRFKALNDVFATAGAQVFYRGEAVDSVDGASFEALDDHYAKDARRVYHADTFRKGQEYYLIRHNRVVPLDDADPATFRVLGERYARDTARVWYEGKRFDVRDVATFEVLSYSFARDRVTGYYMREPVPGSDGATFASVDNEYAKDATHVFYCDLFTDAGRHAPVPRTVRLRDVTASSFRALEYGYATDGARVFYRGAPVKDADAPSFVVLEMPEDSVDARDRGATYHQGRRVGAAK